MISSAVHWRSIPRIDQIARKVAAVADVGLVPILFVGENSRTTMPGRLERRLRHGLCRIDLGERQVLVVYEPSRAVSSREKGSGR